MSCSVYLLCFVVIPSGVSCRPDPLKTKALDELLKTLAAGDEFVKVHAAFDSRINTVVAFAPIVDLFCLKEFDEAKRNDLADEIDLYRKIPELTGKNLFITIGAQDKRVKTDEVIRFAHAAIKKRLTGGTLSIGLNSM